MFKEIDDINGEIQPVKSARRKFLKLAALGGGASLFNLTLPTSTVMAAGHSDVLLLSCMDFRLMHKIENYMQNRGYNNNYDHIILAGASLGALTTKFPAWNKTFWQHLEIAIQLHNIHKVIMMDHRDCGAYKTILNKDFFKNPVDEMSTHAHYLKDLRAMINKRYPSLGVESLLMALDGTVETVT